MATPQLAIDRPYESIDDVARDLAALETLFRSRGDRRGVFASAYLLITIELQRRIADRRFEDNEWVSRCVVAFANLYRQALATYDQGERDRVPTAWQIAFDRAADGSVLILQ